MGPGIFLIIRFNWAKPFLKEHGQMARALHDQVVGCEWVEEVLAGSGGVGGGPASIWVFKLESYASLDRLLKGEDPVSKAYADFFSTMEDVEDTIREEVVFL